MDEKPPAQDLASRIRFLTYALIISGAINIALFATFGFFALKEKEKALFKDMQKVSLSFPTKEITNSKVLADFSQRSFKELIALLSSQEMVEDGYSVRDLALGCLVTFHYFNLEKALPGQTLEQREISFTTKENTKEKVTIFSGLSDYHFEGILHYGYTEKWPLKSQGLFVLLKNMGKPIDPSLEQAIMMTSEFELVRNLFNQKDVVLENSALIALLSEIRWEVIDSFVFEQKQIQDLSEQRRRSFLLTCLEEKSPLGVDLLLKTDFAFVEKKLDDVQVLNLLELFHEKTPLLEKLCSELMKSPRSESVWKMSAEKLYLFAGEKMPEPYNHKAALVRFGLYKEEKASATLGKSLLKKPKKAIVKTPSQNPPGSKTANVKKVSIKDTKSKSSAKKSGARIHKVKANENLYKIAKLYKVDVEKIKAKNNLKDGKIKEGKEIVIP